MSMINNGMDVGDILMLVDEEYDDENVNNWDIPVNESDERAGVPVEIDDDITEDEYEDLLSNDDVANPAGEPSLILKAAMDDSEFVKIEDEVMDIVNGDEVEEFELEEDDYEEYGHDDDIDSDIEDIMEDDEFFENI